MKLKIREQGVLKAVEGKSVWFSRLIAAGMGSSAYYPAEALAASGAEAFPVGTHIHADHQSPEEWKSHPANSVKTIVGVIASTPQFLRAGESVVLGETSFVADVDGLYAKTEYLNEWAPFVEQIHEYIGLSINAQVSIEEAEHDSGKPVLKAFIPSPINTVDIVTAPGADGRILQVWESGILQIDNENTRKDTGMTPEEIKAVAEALKEAVMPAILEALTPEEAETVEDTVSPSDVAEALIEADLPQVAREKVYAAVEAGIDLSKAVEAEKQYISSITEAVAPQGDFKGSGKKEHDFSVAGW